MTGGQKSLLSLDDTAFLEILDRLFVAEGCHSLLWPEATAFLKLQISIHGERIPRFLGTEDHSFCRVIRL